MADYYPDVWQVVQIQSERYGTVFKVLAGWYGGYLNGDSWKLNSGISNIDFNNGCYHFEGYSGSTYICSPHHQRFSGITASVLDNLKQNPQIDVAVISDIQELFEFLKR